MHRLLVLVIDFCDLAVKLRARQRRECSVPEVRQEGGVDARAVLVGDPRISADRAYVLPRRISEDAQARSKEKEPDPLLGEVVHDLGEDRKRRVVDHDVLRPVLLLLVVSARIERPPEVLPVDSVLLLYPCRHDLVNVVWSVAVVGRLLGLELLQKLIVFLVPFLTVAVPSLLPLEPLVVLLRQLLEAEGRHVDRLQLFELLPQRAEVPLRQLSGLVIRKPEGSDLLIREIVRDNARDLLHAEALCAFDSGVPAYHDAILIDDHRDLEAEVFYARGDGLDRSVVVSRVVLVRDQLVDVFFDDLQHQTTSL